MGEGGGAGGYGEGTRAGPLCICNSQRNRSLFQGQAESRKEVTGALRRGGGFDEGHRGGRSDAWSAL